MCIMRQIGHVDRRSLLHGQWTIDEHFVGPPEKSQTSAPMRSPGKFETSDLRRNLRPPSTSGEISDTSDSDLRRSFYLAANIEY